MRYPWTLYCVSVGYAGLLTEDSEAIRAGGMAME